MLISPLFWSYCIDHKHYFGRLDLLRFDQHPSIDLGMPIWISVDRFCRLVGAVRALVAYRTLQVVHVPVRLISVGDWIYLAYRTLSSSDGRRLSVAHRLHWLQLRIIKMESESAGLRLMPCIVLSKPGFETHLSHWQPFTYSLSISLSFTVLAFSLPHRVGPAVDPAAESIHREPHRGEGKNHIRKLIVSNYVLRISSWNIYAFVLQFHRSAGVLASWRQRATPDRTPYQRGCWVQVFDGALRTHSRCPGFLFCFVLFPVKSDSWHWRNSEEQLLEATLLLVSMQRCSWCGTCPNWTAEPLRSRSRTSIRARV